MCSPVKKAICLLLAFLMLFALCACAKTGRRYGDESPAPTTLPETQGTDSSAAEVPLPASPETSVPAETESAPASDFHDRAPVDPDSLPDDLISLLARFGWVGRTDLDSFWGTDINCVLPLMNWGFELVSGFDSYPGPASSWSNTDPLGRWNGCHVYDAEKTDLILRTVYQADGTTIAELREAGEDDFANFYYRDGAYYVSPLGVGGGFVCFPCYVEDDGVKLYIYYAVYYGDGMYYPAGLCYAEVSKADFDGQAVWSLDYWSRTLPVIGMPDTSGGARALGDWILADDGLSSLRMSQHSVNEFLSSEYRFSVGFFRLIGFEAEAQLITDGGIAMFAASDGSGFQGWMEIGDEEIVLHVFSSPDEYGNFAFDGFFDGRDFRFIRAENAELAPAGFFIGEDELAAEIERIRDCYYHPTEADEKIVLSNGADGWSYSREYYFHNGKLVFAFIFNGSEEHRLYFKDGHMIRYIDEHKNVYDFGALAPFADLEERALEEALRLIAPEGVEPGAWLGIWVSGGAEWIQVTAADENGIEFIYHHSSELNMIDTYYALPFLNAEKTFVAEDESLLVYGGWRYAFYLEDGCIRVTSRYPDKLFYQHEPLSPDN